MPNKKKLAKNKKMAKKPVKKPVDPKITAKLKREKSKKKKKKTRYHGKKRRNNVIIGLMSFLIFIFVSLIGFGAYVVFTAPKFNEREFYNSESTIVLDKDEKEIAKLGAQKRELISYEELPQVFVDAIIATEDSRFFQHNGFDIARFTKATVGQLTGNSNAGGGSTITMQISKNYLTNNVATGFEGLARKFTDIYLSVFKIEKDYTKQEIIEFYVNRPYLGAGMYGVEEAAQIYFGKSIRDVALPEAAMIAGLFQAPDSYSPFKNITATESRKDTVLNLMYRHGYINKEERDLAQKMDVKDLVQSFNQESNKYISFIDTVTEDVLKETGKDPYTTPMIIYTTLDPKIQDTVNDVTNGKSYTFVNDEVQLGIAITSVKDGSIVAIGGGRYKVGERTLNYATQIKRHPGSTAKPYMVYGPGFELAKWSTATPFFDEPWSYATGANLRNADNNYRGMISLKDALAKSRNIPAIQGFQQLNNKDVVKFAKSLGVTVEEAGDGTTFESAAIGGFDGVSPLTQSAAYATFARGGIYIEPYSFTKIIFRDDDEVFENKKIPKKVIDEKTAFLVNTVLKSAVDGGLIGDTKISGTDLCGKTGTSTFDAAFRDRIGLPSAAIMDSWVVTYSPDYATAQWYGYKEMTKELAEAKKYLTSSTASRARRSIAQALVNKIMKNNSRFDKPAGVKQVTIETETIPVALPSSATPSAFRSSEWFISGTEPTKESPRFSQLKDVGNINHEYNPLTGSLTISWASAPTPEISTEQGILNYYKNGFSEFTANYNSKLQSKAGTIMSKYTTKRINYNSSYIGSIVYHVYSKDASGNLNLLGITVNNHFIYNTFNPNGITFVIKTAYSIFKDNISPGKSYLVTTSNPIVPDAPSSSSSSAIELILRGGETITIAIKEGVYEDLVPPLNIKENGAPITAPITTEYYNKETNIKIGNIPLNKAGTYTVKYIVNYKDKNYIANRNIIVK